MDKDLTTNQAFDDYAGAFGWDYDNGWSYADYEWDSYSSNAHRWDGLADGTVNQTIQILRRGRTAVCAVHFVGRVPREIWSGEIRTGADFDRLIAIIASYAANNRR